MKAVIRPGGDRLSVVRLLICLVVAGAACGAPRPRAARDAGPATDGGDAAGSDGAREAAPAVDAAELIAASAFCAREIDQEAAWRERCLGGAASDWRAALALHTSCAEIATLLSRGTVRYHAELAEACLDENRADRACSAYETLCIHHVLAGALATDAPCKHDFECPANAGCWADAEFGYNACMPSTCVHLPDQEGEPCHQEPFPYCLAGFSCINGACAHRGAEGEACGADFMASCRVGLTCVNGLCAPRSAHSPGFALGDSCGLPGSPGCDGFAACGPSSTCEPAGHLGQACAQIDGHFVCTEGFCDGIKCQAKVANGGDCFVGAQCASQGCSGVFCKPCGG